MLASNMFLA